MEYIRELMLGKISKENFLLNNNITNLEDVILKGLLDAYETRDSDNVDVYIYLVFLYDMYFEKYVTILNALLNCDWHYQHENIVMILQKLKSSSSVSYLYKEILTDREYLDYNNNESKIVKCLWALGKIGTEQALHTLYILANNENQVISRHAIEQLERIKNN